jgi:pilus assembly protein CpaE
MSRLVLATQNTSFEDRVRRVFDGEFDGDLRYWRDGFLRGDPSRAVRELVNGGADVVALGPGLPADSALELARAFDHDRPEVSVVIVAEPSAALLRSALRAGARDVIAPDAPDAELYAAFQLALGSATRRRHVLDGRGEPPAPTTKVLSVLCPKGGAGKTTVASNLAVGLAQCAPGRVAIIDLDLQFGDVASALRLMPEHTIHDAVQAPQLDATTLKVFLTPYRTELFALCAPTSPVEADDIDAEQVQRILELLVESFEYVVIDTASGLDEAALVALELSTDVVILSAPDVPCVRGTRKLVEALQVLGSASQRCHFVLNRADARTGLSVSDIVSTVGIDVDVAVPESRAVPLSLNQGSPVLEADPRSTVSQSLLQLVYRIAPQPLAASTTNGTSGGGRFRRSR